MVAGAVHDDGPRRPPTEKLLADLDRFASTPLGALSILILGVFAKAFLPDLLAKTRRKRKHPPKATQGG